MCKIIVGKTNETMRTEAFSTLERPEVYVKCYIILGCWIEVKLKLSKIYSLKKTALKSTFTTEFILLGEGVRWARHKPLWRAPQDTEGTTLLRFIPIECPSAEGKMVLCLICPPM